MMDFPNILPVITELTPDSRKENQLQRLFCRLLTRLSEIHFTRFTEKTTTKKTNRFILLFFYRKWKDRCETW